jgi:hypothetical protein
MIENTNPTGVNKALIVESTSNSVFLFLLYSKYVSCGFFITISIKGL